MNEEFSREELLIGKEALERLNKASVALFGVGGVGSYAAEVLARAGVGSITLIDNDTVSVSNINRQLCALHSTVGRYKADVTAERLLDINPNLKINIKRDFVLPENINDFDIPSFDFVIDAIDTVSAKIAIAKLCYESKTNLISCMGTGNKLDPTAFKVTNIFKTSGCPLARVIRRELKKQGIPSLRVVYSEEEAVKLENPVFAPNGKAVPASISFVPPIAGIIAASEAIKTIIGMEAADNG